MAKFNEGDLVIHKTEIYKSIPTIMCVDYYYDDDTVVCSWKEGYDFKNFKFNENSLLKHGK